MMIWRRDIVDYHTVELQCAAQKLEQEIEQGRSVWFVNLTEKAIAQRKVELEAIQVELARRSYGDMFA